MRIKNNRNNTLVIHYLSGNIRKIKPIQGSEIVTIDDCTKILSEHLIQNNMIQIVKENTIIPIEEKISEKIIEKAEEKIKTAKSKAESYIEPKDKISAKK